MAGGSLNWHVRRVPKTPVVGRNVSGKEESSCADQASRLAGNTGLRWEHKACWRYRLALLLLLLTLTWFGLFYASTALADTLADVEARLEGTDLVVRVKFNVLVQYLRHAPQDSGELIEIYFQILSNDESRSSVVEEFRKIQPSARTPGITVIYPLQVTSVQKRILVKFAKPVRFSVRPVADRRSIEIVVAGQVPAKAPVAAPPPETKVGQARYIVALQTFATGDISKAPQIPQDLADYAVFTSASARGGSTLNLGYFLDADSAERARQRLLKTFPQAQVIALEPGSQGAAPTAPILPEQPPGTPSQSTAGAPAQVTQRGAELITKARAALAAGDNEAATVALNELLLLPPNPYSQEAQEMAGVARERSGELEKAKAEYELYLRLYPDSEGAARVRQRLADLAQRQTTARAPGQPAGPLRTFNGSISQYYYDGTTRSQTAFNTPTTVDRATLSLKDLSSLVTNIDLNGRVRTDASDVRLVVRNTNQVSFISANPSVNRLDAAYVDYRGLDNHWLLRAGRQAGTTGGVYGRFDGAAVGYGLSPKWRVNAVAGNLVDFPIDSTRYFYGINVDAENLGDHVSGNVFVINQMVDSVVDRRATGAELRYFDGVRSVYSLVDYDVSFHALNIGMVQGTWQTAGGTLFNGLFDRRKAPLLATSNAIIGQPTTSVNALLRTLSLDQLRQQALGVTADVTQVLASVTTPLNRTWQMGADFRLTNVGSLPAVNDIPATPATGNVYGYTLQAIGNNLYSGRDINVFNVTYLDGPTYHGEYFSYNNVSVLGEKWQLEPSIRLYRQTDNLDITQRRITPGIRLTYRVRERVTLESEYDFETTRTVGPTQQDNTTHHFLYVGYRVDF